MSRAESAAPARAMACAGASSASASASASAPSAHAAATERRRKRRGPRSPLPAPRPPPESGAAPARGSHQIKEDFPPSNSRKTKEEFPSSNSPKTKEDFLRRIHLRPRRTFLRRIHIRPRRTFLRRIHLLGSTSWAAFSTGTSWRPCFVLFCFCVFFRGRMKREEEKKRRKEKERRLLKELTCRSPRSLSLLSFSHLSSPAARAVTHLVACERREEIVCLYARLRNGFLLLLRAPRSARKKKCDCSFLDLDLFSRKRTSTHSFFFRFFSSFV